MKELKMYNVGIYCRLSVEEEGRNGESSSISTQKEMLEKYVKDKGWKVFDCYIDDGYSGTNFNRPSFQRMIDDVEEGKINCVITKDLSRLGRNYILTGQYTEMYFPSKNVRYIALNDGVDTLNNDDNSIAPFVNIMNEFYARDISKKVRTAVRAKKAKGEFLSSFAPYGYMKDPKHITRLIVEEDSAKTVKWMFEMARSGMGSKNICKALNEKGVITPFNQIRWIRRGIPPKPAKWHPESVISILRNRVYLGDTVQGIWECVRFKGTPNKRKPKEEWIVTPNTHEPLIDVDTWEVVQKLISARVLKCTENRRAPQIFAGLVKCEDCGYGLGFATNYNIEHYSCGNYRRYGRNACTMHYIRKDLLEQVILDDIRKYAKLAKNKSDELVKQLQEQNGDKDASQIKNLTADLSKLNARYVELDGILKKLYEDNISGRLTDERFDKFLTDYEAEQFDIQTKIENIEQEIRDIKSNEKDTDSWVKLIREYTKIKKLDRTILTELVDKIVVGEAKEIDGEQTRDITIYYRFVGAVS